ncbi:hypothetical protein [Azospirillum soli]|uniref:hypothetical protein n=1 Tax=Azospirillum soli TaxID=1304799 RepID=UPI001AE7E399|nr:hypothetical protein [Azospirillum soli]MBP2312143.1 hypothetical protein [Azospirillum soli]
MRYDTVRIADATDAALQNMVADPCSIKGKNFLILFHDANMMERTRNRVQSRLFVLHRTMAPGTN